MIQELRSVSGSVQIPSRKDTSTPWNNGWGRPEAIKTEKKWKAGRIGHGEDSVVAKCRHRGDTAICAAHTGLVPLLCNITPNLAY